MGKLTVFDLKFMVLFPTPKYAHWDIGSEATRGFQLSII